MEYKNDPKKHRKSQWKKSGLNMDNFEQIYTKYISTTHCELCNIEFKKTTERRMDHDHETGEFRNIVCGKCNANRPDVKPHGISKHKHIGYNKSRNNYSFEIRRPELKYFKRFKTEQEAIEHRDKFIKENPTHFS